MAQYSEVASYIRKFSSTAQIFSKLKQRGIGVVNDLLYINIDGSVGLFQDEVMRTAQNLGTVGGATITAVEYGALGGIYRHTVLTLTATPMAIADATAGGGVKIYTFPQGMITVLGGAMSVAPTTTSTIATTLKSGVTVEVGVGTATAGAGALTTTEEDIITGATGPSSTTINVAAAAINSARTITPAIHDGHTTALPIYLNLGVPTATDIDADATATFTGTVSFTWIYGGDF